MGGYGTRTPLQTLIPSGGHFGTESPDCHGENDLYMYPDFSPSPNDSRVTTSEGTMLGYKQ